MTYTTIGVCSANVERSGLFEAVMKYELNQQGVKGIEVTSAGINVEHILANTAPPPIQIATLAAGLKYGLVRPEIREAVDRVIQQGTPTDEMGYLYGEMRLLVHGYILALRNQALTEAGITILPVPYKRFDPAVGYDLVLPMAEKDVVKLEARYADAGMEKPRIQTYGSFVNVAELVDDLQSGLPGARRKLEYFMDTRIVAVGKLLELRG